jgi:hypothetical protein
VAGGWSHPDRVCLPGGGTGGVGGAAVPGGTRSEDGRRRGVSYHGSAVPLLVSGKFGGYVPTGIARATVSDLGSPSTARPTVPVLGSPLATGQTLCFWPRSQVKSSQKNEVDPKTIQPSHSHVLQEQLESS